MGTRSPSTPQGSIDSPLSATEFALGCGARFVARGIDTLPKHLPEVFKRAHAHKGASFVEVFQNCIVYNDGVYDHFTAKDVAADRQILVEHGKPLIFGADSDQGIRMRPGKIELEVVTIGEDGITEADILVHDETNKVIAQLLIGMARPEFPVALGVIYRQPGDSFDKSYYENHVTGMKRTASIKDKLRNTTTWTVE